MQEKFAGLEQQVTDQLADFRDHHGQTSEQLKESVQANFSRLVSELRETKKELSTRFYPSAGETLQIILLISCGETCHAGTSQLWYDA
jgi:hypothetical protein